jgi:3-oxoacyl-[acyl-carrier protein] reductase
MLQFNDQLVIVTGGTRGIGRAICSAFLSRGAEVIATYVSSHEAAERFKAEVDGGDRLTLAQFDVADAAAVEKFFDGLESAPSVVINNAGIRRDQIVGMMTQEDWNTVLAVNLSGAFHVTKNAVRAMSRQRYGRIINVSSPSWRLGIKGQANYAASKAGLVAMARTLSKEVARRKITVNCIEPGFVDTELVADLTDAQRAEYTKLVPLGRFGTTDEIAAATLFLASKEAGYITGTTLEVTGGL